MISNHNKIERKIEVSVDFTDGLSIEQVVEEINSLLIPEVIVWYIGCYGLRKAGTQFYKDHLITPVLQKHLQAKFWLMDLSAWKAFKYPQSSIQQFNSCCDHIEALSLRQIKCIKSSEIFKKMQELTEGSIIEYFQQALQREWVFELSKPFRNAGIYIREIFETTHLLIKSLGHLDTSKAYSVFQYFEGCLLIDELVSQLIKDRTHIEIVFALPNDELKYYQDNQGSFQKDVEFLISKRCEAQDIAEITLRIKFLAFQYGLQPHNRPYNAPGDIFYELSYHDIINYTPGQEEMTHATTS